MGDLLTYLALTVPLLLLVICAWPIKRYIMWRLGYWPKPKRFKDYWSLR